MKHKRPLMSVALICVVASLALTVRPAAAAALSAQISNLTCTGMTVSGVTGSNDTPSAPLTIDAVDANSGNTPSGPGDLAYSQTTVGPSQPFSFGFSFHSAVAPGDVIQAQVSDNSANFTIQAVVPAGCVGGTTFFNPGDGRVDPRPGDRIAAYCNTNATGTLAGAILVYGILDDSTGVFLTVFKYTDLVAAGGAGITRSVEPNGTVIAWVSSGGKFYVKWYGGPADATGIGDFRKRFTCIFQQ